MRKICCEKKTVKLVNISIQKRRIICRNKELFLVGQLLFVRYTGFPFTFGFRALLSCRSSRFSIPLNKIGINIPYLSKQWIYSSAESFLYVHPFSWVTRPSFISLPKARLNAPLLIPKRSSMSSGILLSQYGMAPSLSIR